MVRRNKHNPEALVFIDAFTKAGGIQAPGRELSADTQRVIGSHVLMSLDGRPSFMHEPEWMREVIYREMNRAHSEARLVSSLRHPEAVAMRLILAKNAPDPDEEGCRKLAETDSHGLGKGIFPKNLIIVLPTCCDRSYFEVVFRDELPGAAQPVAVKTVRRQKIKAVTRRGRTPWLAIIVLCYVIYYFLKKYFIDEV